MPPKRTVNVSNNPSAQQNESEGTNITQEQEESFKINDEALSKNTALVKKIRTYGAVNAGLLAGLFGMNGGLGFLFYFVFFLLISGVIFYKGKLQMSKFFSTPKDILFGGAGADLTLYLMIWVISHNLVHIL